jgi:hypothetical protein
MTGVAQGGTGLGSAMEGGGLGHSLEWSAIFHGTGKSLCYPFKGVTRQPRALIDPVRPLLLVPHVKVSWSGYV